MAEEQTAAEREEEYQIDVAYLEDKYKDDPIRRRRELALLRQHHNRVGW